MSVRGFPGGGVFFLPVVVVLLGIRIELTDRTEGYTARCALSQMLTSAIANMVTFALLTC